MIDLDNVSKVFEGKRKVVALEKVTLHIEKGEMVSLVGPSGSGKSTLLNLVGGLDHPSSGSISIDGDVLSGLSDDALTKVRRDKIGFIFQFFNLLPT
jgi:putative ABC transport system ATP-binding protein